MASLRGAGYRVDGNGAQQVLPVILPDGTTHGGAVLGEVDVTE